MYAKPNVNVLSLPTLNNAVMKDIGFDKGAVDVMYLDEQIHRTPADQERYKSQLEYLSQFQRSSLLSNSLFSITKIDKVSEGNGASQDDGRLGRNRSHISATIRGALIDGGSIEQASWAPLVVPKY